MGHRKLLQEQSCGATTSEIIGVDELVNTNRYVDYVWKCLPSLLILISAILGLQIRKEKPNAHD